MRSSSRFASFFQGFVWLPRNNLSVELLRFRLHAWHHVRVRVEGSLREEERAALTKEANRRGTTRAAVVRGLILGAKLGWDGADEDG